MTCFIKKIKEDGELIAFIPSAETNKGMILSYMHVGQHSEAAIEFMLHDCVPLTENDNADNFIHELKSIGYNVIK